MTWMTWTETIVKTNNKDASIDNNDKLYFSLTSIYINNINAIVITTIVA